MSETIHVSRESLVPMPPPRPRPATAPRPLMAPRAPMAPSPFGSIFSRTRDIIASNFTDMLDRAEDPAKMIRMIILEMEETLVEVRASAARTIADQKEMRGHIARLGRLQDSWAEKAELAMSKDREDLARAALVEKGKVGDTALQLEAEIEALQDAMRASETDIARLQARLSEARTRQSAIQNRFEHAQNRARMREMVAGPRVEEAFARFELLDRRADLAEAHADALMLGMPPKTLEEEIAELRTAERVDAELAALKARLEGSDRRD